MKRLLAALLFASVGARGFCADSGTTAGLVLLESAGARAAALGEAGTALSGSLDAVSYNPASLHALPRPEVVMKFQSSLGEARLGSVHAGSRTKHGGWAVGLGYGDAGKMTVVDGVGNKSERTAQQDWVASLSGAVGLGHYLIAGLAAKGLRSTIVGHTAQTGALDAGLLARLPLRGLRVGVAAQNIGKQLTYKDAGDPLPRQYRLGASYSYFAEVTAEQENLPWYSRRARNRPVFTVTADAVKPREGTTFAAGGLEWTSLAMAALRVGYSAEEGAGGLAMGLGLGADRYALDYAFRLQEELADVHRLSVSVFW